MAIRREENYDLLRALSCVAVAALHVTALCYGYYGPGTELDSNFWFAGAYQVLARLAVPSFLLLTGAFVLNDPENCDFRRFYRKKALRVIVPALIFSVLYVLYMCLLPLLTAPHRLSRTAITTELLLWAKGDPFLHMWYMYMLFGFYAAAPLLCRLYRKWLQSGSRHLRLWMYGTGFLLLAAGSLIEPLISDYWPVKFLAYLGYFLLGAVIRKDERLPGLKAWVKALFLLGCAAFLAGIYALLFFWVAAHPRLRCGPVFREISRSSYYIYLYHGGVLSVFLWIYTRKIGRIRHGAYWFVPAVTLLVLAVSWLLSAATLRLLRRKR